MKFHGDNKDNRVTDLGVFASDQFAQFHNLVVDAKTISFLDGVVRRPALATTELTTTALPRTGRVNA